MKRYAIVFIFLLWLSAYSPTRAAIDPQLDAAYWFNEFSHLDTAYRQQWHLETLDCYSQPLRDGTTLAWRDMQYALPSYIDMYQWSGDPAWLGVFAERARQVIGYAVYRNGYPSWPSVRDRTPNDELVHDMAIVGVLARFASVAPHHPDARLFRSVAEQVIAKWQSAWLQLDTERGVYINHGSSTIPPRTWPNNIQALAGSVHFYLGHTEQVQAIANTLRSVMRPHPSLGGAVVWNYRDNLIPGETWTPVVDDINHAGVVMSFGAQAMPDMVDSFRATAMGIWGGDNSFSWRIDGSGTMPPNIWPITHYLPYYRHMELGPGLYEAVAAQWIHLIDRSFLDCKPAGQMSISSLVLLHQFPQERVWLPVIQRSEAS